MKIDAPSGPAIHYKSLIESDWLGQWDLVNKQGRNIEATVVIESVDQYRPPNPKKKRNADGSYSTEKLNKLVFSFRGKRKRWLSGPATQQVIAGIYGPNVREWIGKPITLYVDPDVRMGRKVTGGIRVRNTAPTTEPTQEPLDNEADKEVAERIAEAFAGDDLDAQS